MDKVELSRIQIYYNDTPRHWSAHSEEFTGADSLVTAVREGWALCQHVYCKEYLLSGRHYTFVYFFELKRDGRIQTMAIVGNPFIRRLIATLNLSLLREECACSTAYQQAPAAAS